MKKSFIAVAVLGALSTFAFADSSVTLYGKVDLGPAVAKTKGDSAKVSLDSGNYYGSRWGIRGVEDLGGGNAVGFQLEQGFSADTGAASSSSRAFHRISRLYVKGGWGEVGFGRWGALSSGTGPYDMIGGVMWMGDGTTSFGNTNAWDTIASNPGRMNNSVIYVSPDFGGLSFRAMYSNGGSSDDTDKWSKNDHYYGIGGKYAGGGLTTVLTFEVRDCRNYKGDSLVAFGAPESGGGRRDVQIDNNIDKPIYNINFALSYDLGMIVPQFGYTWTKQSNFASQHTFGLSAYSPIGGGRLNYGVRYLFGKYEGDAGDVAKTIEFENDKYTLLTLNVMYEYFLSKRTEVYGYAGWTKGSKAWSDSGRVSNFTGGDSTYINTNGYAVQLGMVHSF